MARTAERFTIFIFSAINRKNKNCRELRPAVLWLFETRSVLKRLSNCANAARYLRTLRQDEKEEIILSQIKGGNKAACPSVAFGEGGSRGREHLVFLSPAGRKKYLVTCDRVSLVPKVPDLSFSNYGTSPGIRTEKILNTRCLMSLFLFL